MCCGGMECLFLPAQDSTASTAQKGYCLRSTELLLCSTSRRHTRGLRTEQSVSGTSPSLGHSWRITHQAATACRGLQINCEHLMLISKAVVGLTDTPLSRAHTSYWRGCFLWHCASACSCFSQVISVHENPSRSQLSKDRIFVWLGQRSGPCSTQRDGDSGPDAIETHMVEDA